MNKPILFFCFSMVMCQTMAQTLQLAPPQTPSNRVFDTDGTTLSFDFRLRGATIRYTIDGSEPSVESAIYSGPLKIKGLKTVKAKSFKPGFQASETAMVQILPVGSIQVDSIAMSPPPQKYLAHGWKTLCDGKLGDDNFQENWLGFDANELELQIFFSRKKRVSRISIGLLRAQKAWIFQPKTIAVYDEKGQLQSTLDMPNVDIERPNTQETIFIKLPKRRHKTLNIKLTALQSLPDWHPGKGSVGWLFLDEVLAW